MSSKSKDDMHKALSMFDMLDVSSLSDESYTIINGKDIKPTVYYLAGYADYLLLNDFVIAELDDASLLRDASLSPEVSVIHCGIKANDALTLEIEADGHMELMVLSSGNNPPVIRVTDLTNGVEYNDYAKDASSSYLSWDMGNEGQFLLYIENSDDEDSTVVIAMN